MGRAVLGLRAALRCGELGGRGPLRGGQPLLLPLLLPARAPLTLAPHLCSPLPPRCKQVRSYAQVFWERYTEIADHEKARWRGGEGRGGPSSGGEEGRGRPRTAAALLRRQLCWGKPLLGETHSPSGEGGPFERSTRAGSAPPCLRLLPSHSPAPPCPNPTQPPSSEQYLKNIERGEARIQRQQDIMTAIATKLDKYRNPWQVRN